MPHTHLGLHIKLVKLQHVNGLCLEWYFVRNEIKLCFEKAHIATIKEYEVAKLKKWNKYVTSYFIREDITLI